MKAAHELRTTQWLHMLSAEVVRAACWPPLPLSVADKNFLLRWTLKINTINWTRQSISPFVSWIKPIWQMHSNTMDQRCADENMLVSASVHVRRNTIRVHRCPTGVCGRSVSSLTSSDLSNVLISLSHLLEKLQCKKNERSYEIYRLGLQNGYWIQNQN